MIYINIPIDSCSSEKHRDRRSFEAASQLSAVPWYAFSVDFFRSLLDYKFITISLATQYRLIAHIIVRHANLVTSYQRSGAVK